MIIINLGLSLWAGLYAVTPDSYRDCFNPSRGRKITI